MEIQTFVLGQESLKGKEFVMVNDINNRLYVTYLRIYGIVANGGAVCLDDYPEESDTMCAVDLCVATRVITQAVLDAGNTNYRADIRSPSNLRKIIMHIVDDLESPAEPAESDEDTFDEEHPVDTQ